jgi:Superfamily I DNA and RNA helicases
MRRIPIRRSTSPTQVDPDPEAEERILDGLNEKQREAVTTTEGPVMIIAGPGSGKTRALTHRIAYLLATGKAQPRDVLALTFTNKAAGEMQERVEALVGDDAKGMWVSTFHSAFARLLRREGDKLGYSKDFSIYDTSDSKRLIRQQMKGRNLDTDVVKPRSAQRMISSAKNEMIGPQEYAELARGDQQEMVAEVYPAYERALRQANALDFDDLLLKPIDLFEQHEDVLEKYQTRWQYVHIDEYQDTNQAQYVLARKLSGRHENLCVVGDDAQSIYAFRGADITNILNFDNDYPDATTIRLERNYRSTENIIAWPTRSSRRTTTRSRRACGRTTRRGSTWRSWRRSAKRTRRRRLSAGSATFSCGRGWSTATLRSSTAPTRRAAPSRRRSAKRTCRTA